MKAKHFIVSALFCIFFFSLKAQFSPGKGFKQLNVGVGMSSWGMPVYSGFDIGVANDITVGGEFSFRNYSERWFGAVYRHRVIGVSANMNYHFNNLLHVQENWDLYAGLNAGFYVWNSSSSYPGKHTNGLGIGGQLGARYYFKENLALNLEFGSGNAWSGGKIGISFVF